MMTIPEKIRQRRKSLHISQEELSNLVGVSLKTVQRWESGERSPRIEEMTKLVDVLNMSLGYVVGTEDDNKQPISPELSEKNVLSIKENKSEEKNTNMASIILDNGRRVEAPATPEGLAFLKEVFAMSLGNAGVMKGVTA